MTKQVYVQENYTKDIDRMDAMFPLEEDDEAYPRSAVANDYGTSSWNAPDAFIM